MDTIRVEDVFDPEETNSVIVSEDESLEDIIARLAKDPCIRGLFLVDRRQRFAGVITRPDLLKWASLQLGRQAGSRTLEMSRRDLLRFALSTQAKDVAHGDWRTLGVKPSDTLAEALDQMLRYEVVDIPVLGRGGEILGDLRLSQVLLKALEVAKEESEG